MIEEAKLIFGGAHTRKFSLFRGDCLQVMKSLESESCDSLVTDPPAGISFMGKAWDDDKGGRTQWIAWLTDVMRECLRVLKPGAHALVWAIPRTSHWTMTALEEAGFEVRDVITHLFGTGFPKSLDVSKAIDKAAGATREIVGVKPTHFDSANRTQAYGGFGHGENDYGSDKVGFDANNQPLTAPATDDAKRWQGWGTALKPAAEFWILVRKPLGEKTVAANVLRHGTGAVNIDASRIGSDTISTHGSGDKLARMKIGESAGIGEYREHTGRFPANVVFSHSGGCVQRGMKDIKLNGSGKCSGETTADKSMFGIGSKEMTHGNGDGTETVEAWDCEAGCAVAELDRQSGSLAPGNFPKTQNTKSWKMSSNGRRLAPARIPAAPPVSSTALKPPKKTAAPITSIRPSKARR